MDKPIFDTVFEALTGYRPLRWQRRLYGQFLDGDFPETIDLPTGMGKTSVMAIWLIARESQPSTCLPTRLVYVVDRRTVVDQATALAEALADRCVAAGVTQRPMVSTLRGRFADNRDWTLDPSAPAIIIGTVDMIGSRLLFSGYRSSYKWRPLDAGLLGQDSLLILDEAHLSEPFAKLLRDIGSNGPFQRGCGKPARVICMSATVGGRDDSTFRLAPSDLEGDSDSNVVAKRFLAEKHLYLHEATAKMDAEIVEMATELAKDGSRVVVFVRSPEVAAKVAERARDHGDKRHKPFKDAVEVLTGTMRGLERDELLDKPVMKRFLCPENSRTEGPAILVSTSAGEVGFDLNGDHLVCDAAPLDSIIQRLGRVNRRGQGVAHVHIFVPRPRTARKKGEGTKSGGRTYDTAAIKATEILKGLPKLADGSFDACPRALADLEKPDDAMAPKPKTVELTDILLDAWSMTTIVAPMPGRPPVADWLRGIAEDLPDTTIAWRAELDVGGFGDLDVGDIEEWFDAHRVLQHETLVVPTHRAAEWLLERWQQLGDDLQKELADRPCLIEQGGLRVLKIKQLVERLKRGVHRDIVNADIILPASFGGIERGEGLLKTEAPKSAPNGNAGALAKASDVADARIPGACRRYRLIKAGESEEALCGDEAAAPGGFSKFVLDLPPDGDSIRQLVSMVPKRDRPEFGSEAQALADHVNAAERHANDIAVRLALEKPIATALQLAARWHDAGKRRRIWQDAVGGSVDNPLGKSGGRMRPIAAGYRHEFGSLREFLSADAANDEDVVDLAAHLIAAHHGRGRPHFPKGGFDPEARAASPEIAMDAVRRFTRLQRRYGHWRLAWLENLLRCADALASAENDGGNAA
jgi:CRISPR-associated endonuclease/helicase Cas3